MTNPKVKNRQKIQRLAHMARDLRAGEYFKITRLTTIKSLAQEPKSANRFVLHLAETANEVIQKSQSPKGMTKGDWKTGQNIAAVAVEEMRRYVKRRSKSRETMLHNGLRKLRKLQNEQKSVPFGAVRIVHSKELLIVEKALVCCLSPHDCDHWAYEVARDYAERYGSKYPAGLIPASAPMVEDVAEFWCRELLGKSLQEEFGDRES